MPTHIGQDRVAALTCFSCGSSHDPTRLNNVCDRCGLPLKVEVALPDGDMRSLVDTDVPSMWRYSEVLPIDRADAVSLGEGWTPIIEVEDDVWLKDESGNPAGSFKSRGMSMAVSAAVRLGAQRLVVPTAGFAGAALSAYGAETGVQVTIAMPRDTPTTIVDECLSNGATVHLVDGTIADAGRWLADNREAGEFDVSTLKEPYRVEGKKTMGYELYEQFGFTLPDVVIYPTGGGTGLVGMWKAWDEMEQMGWIDKTRPRLVCVQSSGCAPIVEAHNRGELVTRPWPNPETKAFGLRVPAPIGGFLCLSAIRETRGTAVAVPDPVLLDTMDEMTDVTGVDMCPEGGAAWAAFRELRAAGWIEPGEKVVVWNTGSGNSYRST
jgi:threonine synthase